MTDARCEPPEHLRGVDGWHWVTQDGSDPVAAKWEPGWWLEVYMPGHPEMAYARGWRYLAPVPSPDAVRALVEAARRVDAPCMEGTDEPLDACPRCGANADQQCGDEFREHVFAALRAALAAFPEEQT